MVGLCMYFLTMTWLASRAKDYVTVYMPCWPYQLEYASHLSLAFEGVPPTRNPPSVSSGRTTYNNPPKTPRYRAWCPNTG